MTPEGETWQCSRCLVVYDIGERRRRNMESSARTFNYYRCEHIDRDGNSCGLVYQESYKGQRGAWPKVRLLTTEDSLRRAGRERA